MTNQPENNMDNTPDGPPEYTEPMDAETAAAMGAGPEPDMDFSRETPPPPPPNPVTPPPPAYTAPAPPPPPTYTPPPPPAATAYQPPGTPAAAAAPAVQPLTPSEERTWAALAHAASLLAFVTGFGGLAGAGLIWLVYKDRSRYVGYQAAQSFWFQVAGLVFLTLFGTITAFLLSFFIGICLVPFWLVAALGVLIYPLIGAYQTSQGQDFRYLIIGDMVPRE